MKKEKIQGQIFVHPADIDFFRKVNLEAAPRKNSKQPHFHIKINDS